MEREFSQQIFKKYSDKKFNDKPSSGGQVLPCRQTDVTKQIVAFCNFANASKKHKDILLH